MVETTLCYLEKGESYLMLHRVKKKNDVNHDKWIGLGGKLEVGESPQACVVREVEEECGLRLLDHRYRGVIGFTSNEAPEEKMHLFTASAWEGEEHPCDEGELAWILKEELRKLPMWEGDAIFLDLLEQEAPFFTLSLRYWGDDLVEAVLNGEKIR